MARDIFPDDYHDSYVKPTLKYDYEELLQFQMELENWERDLDKREKEALYRLRKSEEYFKEESDHLTKERGEVEIDKAQVERVKSDCARQLEAVKKRQELLDGQHTVLAALTTQLEKANREPLDVINDVLLQLELEVDPIEIAKRIREIGKSLDVKW